VLGTAPAIFGMAAASFMLCQLAGSPFDGEPIIQLTAQQYDRALIRLQQREEEVFGNSEGLPVDRDDVSCRRASGIVHSWCIVHVGVHVAKRQGALRDAVAAIHVASFMPLHRQPVHRLIW
jgi:hypothetical protein